MARRLFGEFYRLLVLICWGHRLPFSYAQRPVHWILWSPRAQKAVIVIPEEAEALIPIISKINPPNVHLIVYAAPITKQMLHFNHLDYYTIPKFDGIIPTQVKIEIGLLAGRLYFEFSECKDIGQYLDTQEEHFSERASSYAFPCVKGFASQPFAFLEEWFSVTRKGQDYAHTPMGYICQGRPLRRDHPFFSAATADHSPSASTVVNMNISGADGVGPFNEDSDEDEHFLDDDEDEFVETTEDH